MVIIGLIFTGVLAGILGGMLGVGGGIVMIPILVYLFKFSQVQAQGISLAALLPPVTFLAVMKYYKAGNLDIKTAALVSLGLIGGFFLGAAVANSVPTSILQRIFGAFLIVVGIKMLF